MSFSASARACGVRRLVLVLMMGILGVGCSGEEAGTEEPASVAAQAPVDTMTIDHVLRTDDRFSTLVAALDSTGLDSTLRSEGPYTLFAPPNAAFEALPPGTLSTLLNDRPARLRLVLEQHVVPQRMAVAGRTGTWRVPTLAGDSLRLRVTDTTVTVRNAQVADSDIETANGLIHVVDRVLRPPEEAAEEDE